MRNIKLVIEYDGTCYCGWQVQKNGLSIQEVLQKGVQSIVRHDIALIGSSRTDAGVHARGMVANFLTSSTIPEKNLPAAINTKIPHDIVVLSAEIVSINFHSRYDSKGKRYSYSILNRKEPSAILRNYTAHIHSELDILRMRDASQFFIGTHNFSAFKSSGSSIKDNIRKIEKLDILKQGDIIKIDIEADGFLYNMVRIISGTLIDVGKGKIEPSDIPEIIESEDRDKAGKTAPPQGLCLECVFY